ncbi:bll6467 [Bradyrhizobium diazoefficiens USDA 110]|uniref:Bll6467 protein n=1 Tax=Bradyrhizobium diazoefficiens (strain JCM 10833 / BCRC 13528 / IAM 13628 / NBRC 14792 / USDA 110) TaxID=224911 RepID=Q89G78_BRADU|nr:hypothetical protein Bdiaspc4_34100 [Bradyrhizobium diazoefficiens]BAC51732.1 bll6467 [Bradyrhizobium diazoefficiens USDA 110]
MAFDEIAEIVGQCHAIDVASRANLAGDVGRDVLHPVFERVERDHLDRVVEAAGDELADRGLEIASLDADFGRLVAAIDHHEQGLVCAIRHDRGWHARSRHLGHSRLGFRSPLTGKTGRRFLCVGKACRARAALARAALASARNQRNSLRRDSSMTCSGERISVTSGGCAAVRIS